VVGTCTRSSSANAGNSGGAVASPSVYRRHFEADIIVRKDLKPSFSFPSFSLQVSSRSLSDTRFVLMSLVLCSTPFNSFSTYPDSQLPRTSSSFRNLSRLSRIDRGAHRPIHEPTRPNPVSPFFSLNFISPSISLSISVQ
jgi:hypothetical protein